ncbi:MAG: cell division protein FtsZ [Candidatus Woesearchaeota archaeon]
MNFLVQNAIKTQEAMQEQGLDEFDAYKATIKVIGCGGAGNNMVNWLYQKGVYGAQVIAVNTDAQHLKITEAHTKILIGRELTRGLGCGGFPEKGEEAAKESMNEIRKALEGADMVFVCAGMGGGTGTGSAPVVARIARDLGAIVIGTVTMPFDVERARIDKAEIGLRKLREHCDTVIVIDNNRLVKVAGNLPVKQAFAVANEIIATMIRGIVETIAKPSLVNLDFADVKAIMSNGGVAAIGIGMSNTKNRVEEAVQAALSNPLLDINYEGATGALVHVAGGPDMTLEEVNRAVSLVTASMSPDANVIFGARIDDELKGQLMIMTIITGVKSPWILGKPTKEETKAAFREELGIELL